MFNGTVVRHSSWHSPDTTWPLEKILEETPKLEVTEAR